MSCVKCGSIQGSYFYQLDEDGNEMLETGVCGKCFTSMADLIDCPLCKSPVMDKNLGAPEDIVEWGLKKFKDQGRLHIGWTQKPEQKLLFGDGKYCLILDPPKETENET